MMRWLRRIFGRRRFRQFKPCVVYIEGLSVTQMLLADTTIVWHPWRGTAGMGHAVDLGYRADTGELVGIAIWDDVRKPLRQG